MTRAGKAGIPGERRARKFEGQFIGRLVAMMESPAYRVLSLSARRCLDRIEIELANHGGHGNGELVVTHEQFVAYGVHHNAIAPALRELEALGFIEITEHGSAGNAAERTPNKFRLTYRNEGRARPTHEWRRITSTEEAMMAAQDARSNLRENYRVKKQKPSTGLCEVSLPERGVQTGTNARLGQKVVPPKPVVLSRSPGGTPGTPLSALPASSAVASMAGARKSTRPRRRKLRWPKLNVTEIVDLGAIEDIQRDAARAMADAKCAKCQPDPFVITIGSKRVVTRDLKAA
jgi:DNA-binding PadR family transcriptional regulator